MELDYGDLENVDLTACPLDIVVIAGQSNAEGYGQGADGLYEPRDDVFFASVDYTCSNFVCTYSGKIKVSDTSEHRLCDNSMRGCLSSGFAPLYADKMLEKGRRLLFVQTAVGGTGFTIGYWGVGRQHYEKMVETTEFFLSMSKENRLVGVLWHQGEHDAFERPDLDPVTRCATYRKNFYGQMSDYRARFGSVPIVTGDFTPRWRALFPVAASAVREGMILACHDLGRAAFVGTDDLIDNGIVMDSDDNIHFCRRSLCELGKRYYGAFSRIVNADKK